MQFFHTMNICYSKDLSCRITFWNWTTRSLENCAYILNVTRSVPVSIITSSFFMCLGRFIISSAALHENGLYSWRKCKKIPYIQRSFTDFSQKHGIFTAFHLSKTRNFVQRVISSRLAPFIVGLRKIHKRYKRIPLPALGRGYVML